MVPICETCAKFCNIRGEYSICPKKISNNQPKVKNIYSSKPSHPYLKSIKCANCGEIFISKSPRNRFCSTKCCNAYQKRGAFLIINRDDFKCFYCGKTSYHDNVILRIDHVIPCAKGGEDIAGNLVTACNDCNLSKGKMELSSYTLVEIKREISDRNKRIGLLDNQKIALIASATSERRIEKRLERIGQND